MFSHTLKVGDIMYVLKKNQIVFMCLAVLFSISFFSFQEPNTVPTSSTPVTNHRIVLDAGHGFPDRWSSK